MRKIYKKSIIFAVSLIFSMCFYIVAYAQGTTSISVSKSSIGVGDTTVVSVSASASGTVTVKYTASIMNLIDCTASGYSYEGNTITFSGTSGDIKFKSTAEGKACIIVSSSSCTGSSTTINVGNSASSETKPAEEAPKKEDEKTEEETTTEDVADETTEETDDSAEAVAPSAGTGSGTLNSDGGFDIDGVSYVVSERYTDKEIPSGFSKTSISIGTSTYNELSNGNVTIIYLKPADNTSGSGQFYVYSENTGTVTKLSMLGNTSHYVMIATSGELFNPNLTQASFSTDAGDFAGYTFPDSEFYYVYGFNEEGTVGWYSYDSVTKTVSRVDEKAFASGVVASTEAVAEASDEETYNPVESYKKKLDTLRLVVCGLIILCVILIFVLINLAVRKAKGEDDDIFNDNDDVFSKKSEKTKRHGPRSIVYSSKNDDIFDDSSDDVFAQSDDEEDDELASSKTGKTGRGGFDMMDLNDL